MCWWFYDYKNGGIFVLIWWLVKTLHRWYPPSKSTSETSLETATSRTTSKMWGRKEFPPWCWMNSSIKFPSSLWRWKNGVRKYSTSSAYTRTTSSPLSASNNSSEWWKNTLQASPLNCCVWFATEWIKMALTSWWMVTTSSNLSNEYYVYKNQWLLPSSRITILKPSAIVSSLWANCANWAKVQGIPSSPPTTSTWV